MQKQDQNSQSKLGIRPTTSSLNTEERIELLANIIVDRLLENSRQLKLCRKLGEIAYA